MEPNYFLIYEQAAAGASKFYGMLDRPRHPMAMLIRKEIGLLTHEVRASKGPRSLEDRIKTIQGYLIQARQKGYEIMRIDENIALHQHYEQLRRELRKLDRY